MSKLDTLKKHLTPGRVYRRSDLLPWTTSVDRHLVQLVEEGTLEKLSGGLYHHPKQTRFGAAPADDAKLVEAFLNDHRFLLMSPNAYNTLGVGSTQLYNETVVYNHKRRGKFTLGGRVFDFRQKPHFPRSLSEEFLMVDMVNNLGQLAEDQEFILNAMAKKVTETDQKSLKHAVREYGGLKARKFFSQTAAHDTMSHG